MAIPATTPKALLIRGILPIIPPRSNRKAPEHPDCRRYGNRNTLRQTTLSFESLLNLALGVQRCQRRVFQHVRSNLGVALLIFAQAHPGFH